jgi:histidine triad (HIT) family protein
MNDCIFCKIVSGDLPSYKLFEDEHTLAILDIHPVSTGHALVIPKDHFENIYTTPAETMARLMLTAQKVAIAIKQTLSPDGINISMNNEPAAWQVIFHSHIHLIPRSLTDGFKPLPQGNLTIEDGNSLVQKIKEEIE